MAKSPNVESLERDGFVVIRSALTPGEIEKLRDACQRVTALARQGQWPHVRTLPKQFPPWNVKEGQNPAEAGIWGVQGLMHPAMLEHDLFTATYFSDALINPTKELLQCGDDELVMELFNLLVRPDHDFELRWHRDDISEKATPEEELERLAKPAWHTQWNLALYDDSSLIVVPGSHRRARTATERAADPYEKGLPGELHVQMGPGDVVFYNNNILHRGAYNSEKERMTLHGSVGHSNGGSLRARNVLQHGLREWIDQCDFSKMPDLERGRAEGMRRRLIELANKSGDVGYSLEG
ncbi:hypothetical protein PV08_11551 [Exophiala spinifera]|uniref:Phytanoyl-CoA dioxygenase n=1 Tax=Exophiala spinifera TaxID=91928 RepID=A0A0D1ZC52_9EURO|nr:uncharacterized protein PV08_11551 [Exophiala spinifera]KIW10587.1 hypothetical protein PV08_11551 [Exophiala spinifera]